MRLRDPWPRPVFLLLAAACLTAVVVQPGELGSIDTARRLQTTRSLWTAAPPVVDSDYPNFGIIGRDGRIFASYGIGQSLAMLPADITAATAMRMVPLLAEHPGFEDVFVSYTVSTIICVLAILM